MLHATILPATRPSAASRRHRKDARSQRAYWRQIRVYITLRTLKRIDAMRTPHHDRSAIIGAALEFAIEWRDKDDARRKRKAAAAPALPDRCAP